jgi:hypothetical protein
MVTYDNKKKIDIHTTMDFHDYNGIDYELSPTSQVPVRISWDDNYLYNYIFGGAVVVTWKITYRSPVERIIEIERIRVLDLIDIPSFPQGVPGDALFFVGNSEVQTLVSIQGDDLQGTSDFVDLKALFKYTKYTNTDAVPRSWPCWLVVQGHRLFNAYQDKGKLSN